MSAYALPARVRRSGLRQRARWLAVAGCALLTLLGLSGFLTPFLFSLASPDRWAVCGLIPLAGIGLLLTDRPMTVIGVATVACAPFAQVPVDVDGLVITPLAVLCVLGLVVSLLVPATVAAPIRRSVSQAVFPVFAVLLLPAMLLGAPSALSHVFTMLTLLFAIGAICLRAVAVDRAAPAALAGGLVATAVLQSGVALYELHTGHRVDLYGGAGVGTYGPGYFFGYEGTFRPGGTFSDPISLGNVLAIALPFAFALATSPRIAAGARLLAGAAAGLLSVALAVTLSRMSWIGAAAGLAVTVLVSGPGQRRGRALWLAGAGVLLPTVMLGVAGRSLVERLDSIVDPTASGVPTAPFDLLRQRLWHTSWQLFTGHPVFGIGFDRLADRLSSQVAGSGIYTHAHSTYLQYLTEAGLVGAGALACVLVAAGVDVRRGLRGAGRYDPVAAGAAGALVAVVICWLTDYVVRYPAVLACVGVLFALIAGVGRPAVPAEGPDR